MVDGHLNFDTQVSTKGFNKGVNLISKSADKLKGLMFSLGGAIAAAFSMKEVIEAAAEVKALNSQFEQTFGSLRESASATIQKIADDSGILETRLKSTASSIYAFAKTAGMDGADALNLMNDALKVTADSAAYYDRSLEETAETLKSYLKGNFANDAALGLSSTEATRNAKALELFGKKYTELSEAQKQVALIEMVKDANRLSGAMGQAAREADGWENVIGNLKEAWKQLLAVIGQPVLAVAVPLVQRLTAALQRLAQVAQAVTNAFADLFGLDIRTADSSSAVADNASQAAESYEDMAEAAQEAQEANENSLASFDQINKLSDSEQQNSGGSSSAGSQGSTTAAGTSAPLIGAMDRTEQRFDELTNKIKHVFETLFDPLRRAWSRYGEPIMQHAGDIFDTVAEHARNIGNSFLDWAGGLDLDPLFASLDGLLEALEPFADNVGEGLEWFFDNVLEPFDTWTVEEAVPTFLDTVKKAIEGLSAAWETAAPVIKEELWDKFLKPVAEWAADKSIELLEDLGDAIKDLGESITEKDVKVLLHLAGAIGAVVLAVKGKQAVDGFAKSISGLGGKLSGAFKGWNEPLTKSAAEGGATWATKFFAAIGAFFAGWEIGSMIREAMGGDEFWDDFFEPFFDACANVGTAIANFFTETIPNAVTGAIDKLLELNDRLWSTIFSAIDSAISFFTETIPAFFSSMCEDIVLAVTGFADNVKQTALNAWEGIKNAFSSVGTWFKTKFTDAWTNIKEIFSLDNVKTHFDSVLDKLKNVFMNIGSWFGTKFRTAWDKIKEVFSLDNVKEHFTSIVNKIGEVFGGLANILKTPINAVIDVVNTAIDKINGISVDIPDWVPEIGGGRLGFNIPKIPRLARGTVVPAGYGEFLAVLGDNKREAEVVSPISAIKQAVMEAAVELGSVGGNGSKQPMTVYVQVDRKTIGQVVIDDINDKTRRNGRSPHEG